MEKLIEFKDVKAFVREDTSDLFVVKEVNGGEYDRLDIRPTDVVVDFWIEYWNVYCICPQ